MDDYLSWQAGALQLGMYRVGPMREVYVYAAQTLPLVLGHKPMHHLRTTELSIVDDFGNLVPIAAWRRYTEEPTCH